MFKEKLTLKTDAFEEKKFRRQPLALFELSPSSWPGSALKRFRRRIGPWMRQVFWEYVCAAPPVGKPFRLGAGERRYVPKSAA